MISYAKYVVAVLVVIIISGFSFFQGYRRGSAQVKPPVVVTKEVPVERVINRDVVQTVTRTVTVPGKPVVIVKTVTEMAAKTDEHDKLAAPAVCVTQAAPSSQPATSDPSKWEARVLVGGQLDGKGPLFGLGVEYKLAGPLWIGAEGLTDAKGSLVGAGTVGVRF